ncbi:3'(2'),5'-bisphosphate nucleotidase CysQ [Shewanella sp. NIFS-20-20]|nr:3'(2'),5'-bisphosphate nucleotidase CysQ [Shewanella sp. NIFS-20-20]
MLMAIESIDKPLILQLVALAKNAGERMMPFYQSTNLAIADKADTSPLTAADLASHDCIVAGLQAINCHWPILSEESDLPSWSVRKGWSRYFLIDPLDGTKEFIKGNGEFTVNIAVIDNGQAIAGVVYAPAKGHCYFGALGLGAWVQADGMMAQPLGQERQHSQACPVIVGSRSHPSPELAGYLSQFSDYQVLPVGSSLKFCLLAEGRADIYPRLGPTSEWDTAAAQAVLEAAGGQVHDKTTGKPLRYNQKDSIRNPHFIAYARQWLVSI